MQIDFPANQIIRLLNYLEGQPNGIAQQASKVLSAAVDKADRYKVEISPIRFTTQDVQGAETVVGEYADLPPMIGRTLLQAKEVVKGERSCTILQAVLREFADALVKRGYAVDIITAMPESISCEVATCGH